MIDLTTPCIPFATCIDDEGYGHSKRTMAHRVAYTEAYGPIPAGFQVDHVCHNADTSCPGGPCLHRRCVNPLHLEAVTARENILRSRGRSAVNAAKTSCSHGHPYDEVNTYWVPSGAATAAHAVGTVPAGRHHDGARCA